MDRERIIEQIQEQIFLKKSLFLESVMDASDQENPIRIILKVKGRTHHVDEVMSHFFFTTDLETSLRVNLNMIGLDGKPQVKNLKEILLEWIKYRLITIANKLSWELNKIQKQKSSGLILFSSGSAGNPKAMIHNLDNLVDSFKENFYQNVNEALKLN